MPRAHQVPPGVRYLAMSIAASVDVRHLPFRGTSDPSLPNEVWVADAFVTGDASGGDQAVNTVLTQASDIDESFWSLEQLALQIDRDVALGGVVKFANQRNYADPASPRTSTVTMAGAGGVQGTTSFLGRDHTLTPYFMGQGPAVVTGLQLFIILATANVDTLAMRSHLWGYRWGAGCMDTPTGPRRPLGSVFGH